MAASATALARKREIVKSEEPIRTICLTVQPMNAETFAPYGQIVTERGDVAIDIDGGKASVTAQTVESRPMVVDFLGRHLRSEQFFAPLGATKSVIALAPPCVDEAALPDITKLAAFLVDGECAFKLHRGTWHASAFPLTERASFLVLDRENTLEEDYDLRDLKTTLGVVVQIQQ
ncbi:MAG TPA: ureidoglycolate lyase [Blastocatellia bacterium]|nr:ureidoglycolate lyase [Blastocatellia bacterium]